jgi:CDP-glycerol glycerophosphotransferase (TagB/SpsB family)
VKFRQLANIAIALLLLPFCRSLRRQKFVLVGGHEGELVADNSKALYEFLATQQRDFAVHWVLNSDSPDRDRVTGPIARGSVRNYLRFLTADGVFFSHTCSDVAPILHNFWRGAAVRFFIEHGIVGLKKAKLAPDSRSSHLGPEADLWVASSAFEKDIKVREWGLPEERVRLTGLARYDKLVPPPGYRKEILFMPTWREWLADHSEAEFVQTQFYRDLNAVIVDPRLQADLADNDYRLVIYLHFYFHKFIKTFEIPGNASVSFLPPEADVQDYIINSGLLITDYSSVAWDFLYLGKPVLFFQPDLDTYLEVRGSYLDLRTELFGPQSFDAGQLAGQVADAINGGADLTDGGRSARERYFAFHDTSNCRRIFEEFLRYRTPSS